MLAQTSAEIRPPKTIILATSLAESIPAVILYNSIFILLEKKRKRIISIEETQESIIKAKKITQRLKI